MHDPTLPDLLDLATTAAYRAGRLTLGYFNTGVAVETKADDTPVTRADRDAETLIRSIVQRHYPQHAILGEEHGQTASDSSYRWIIDPIDGTKSFIHGVPLYATLVAVEIAGRPSVGAIYLPALDEMICAADGLGCWWNGRRARVSQTGDLAAATLVCSDTTMADARSDRYAQLARRTRLQRTWGDAYGYALVATGRADITLDPMMNPWDCGPLLPVLREAGGCCTAWTGQETINGGDLFATNALLHEQVLNLLREEDVNRLK